MAKLTEQDLAGLSENERAALLEGEADDEALHAAAGDEDEEAAAEEARKAAELAAADAANKEKDKNKPATEELTDEEKAAAVAADAAAAAAEPAKTPAPADIAPPGSRKVADTLVPGADTKITETLGTLDKQLNELDTKLQDGEVDAAQYASQSRKINDQRIQLFAEQAAEKARIQTIRETSARSWQDEQDYFFRKPENAIFDAEKNPVLFDALDAQIRRITSKPENAGMLLRDVLATARTDVLKAFGHEEKPADANEKGDGKGKEKVSDQSGKDKTRQQVTLPPTLGKIPQASGNGTDGEFDHLDTLDGMELERALGKLTPDQQDRYLRGS